MNNEKQTIHEFDLNFIYDENGILSTYNRYYYGDSGAGYSPWHKSKTDELVLNTDYTVNQLYIPETYYTNDFLLPTDFEIGYMITELNHESGNEDYLKRYYYSEMVVTGIN